MLAAGRLDPVGERDRIDVAVLGVAVGDLPVFAGVDTGVEVPAGVGRAGEADLVPGPRVGVERGAGVAGPQTPHVGGGQVVPGSAVGGEVLDGLDQQRLLVAEQPREAVPAG